MLSPFSVDVAPDLGSFFSSPCLRVASNGDCRPGILATLLLPQMNGLAHDIRVQLDPLGFGKLLPSLARSRDGGGDINSIVGISFLFVLFFSLHVLVLTTALLLAAILALSPNGLIHSCRLFCA